MAERPSRRTALTLGLVGAGTVGAGLAGLKIAGAPPFSEPVASTSPAATDENGAGVTWAEPPVLASEDGFLELDLTAAPAQVEVAGGTATMLAYNGSVPGPTLHLSPGDTLRVRLTNGLDEPTNLHTHGLQVSPLADGDNPFISIEPGQSFDYVIVIDPDHPHGVFWYHPHHHGTVADQVFGGLYGAIVIDRDDWSQRAPRVAVVSDVTLVDGGVATVSAAERRQGRLGEAVLVNGLLAPDLATAPGATERLLLINACASRYLDLDPGGATVRVRGIDGGTFDSPRDGSRLLLAPGNRADLEIDMVDAPVTLTARAHGIGSMGMGMMSAGTEPEDALLLTLVPDAKADTPAPVPPASFQPRDLREVDVDARRTLTFTMAMGGGGMRFLIDGEEFDGTRIDQQADVGTVEEWTLRNRTMMDHPFHLHVWPMQLTEADGIDLRDVVDVPAGEDVVVRIGFDRVPGTTVYHCHVLDHEDLGMMGVIDVAPAVQTGAEVPEGSADVEG
ncbi:multicopper oxidase family protein [Demequina lignilytica]|uniref:Multicopper oxidase family protein n=1 Tax=Demequina lignilytica TaxID=3051663 RepID=A0AB35MJQ5_9MICO|nr:multicopper oxidase family protein [Demequina sp. SYSU T0a273]MDN4484032.1 multicopper oxidase family protein [Demequina sp. SYSU T0a273]